MCTLLEACSLRDLNFSYFFEFKIFIFFCINIDIDVLNNYMKTNIFSGSTRVNHKTPLTAGRSQGTGRCEEGFGKEKLRSVHNHLSATTRNLLRQGDSDRVEETRGKKEVGTGSD